MVVWAGRARIASARREKIAESVLREQELLMGMPSFVWIVMALVTSLAGGGPNDLLGYLSTDQYWRAKNVHPKLEQLMADLAPTQVADVSKLINNLSSPDPAVREQAGKKIVAMGPGALPQLDDAAKDPSDAETATRS